MKEVQIDTLVGPTHFYGGLAFGNVASIEHKAKPSSPKKAALQGLEKMKLLMDLGVEQLVLPPHERPAVWALRQLGFSGSEQKVLEEASTQAPLLFRQCSSQAAMWTANAATVTTSDGKVHITPANLIANYHRSIEPTFTANLFKAIFPEGRHFMHHPPLPASLDFADEGGANHTAFYTDGQWLDFFVYGRDGSARLPKRYPARQTHQAQEAIVRLHEIDPQRVVFAQQNPEAIDAGVFHNDVISVGHESLFLYHEKAFVNTPKVIKELLQKAPLELYEVKEKNLSLAEAVKTYLFNSQIVRAKDGSRVIICPKEVERSPRAKAIVEAIPAFDQVVYLSLDQSMKNGGGPACLRLRLPLEEQELAAIHQGVRLTYQLYRSLKELIEREYPDSFTPLDLLDSQFRKSTRRLLSKIAKMLYLPTIYQGVESGTSFASPKTRTQE